MFNFRGGTLVSSDNVEVMFAIIAGIATLSIILEQKYKWAAKMTGAVLALIGALVLSNLNIIPIGSTAENIVWSYVVPLAIPMLLFKVDIKKIWKESGKMLIIYLISSVGTLLGGIIAVLLLGNMLKNNAIVGDNVEALVAMMSGSYIGGGVNFAAMANAYNIAGTPLAASAVVADNLLMVLYFFVLMSFAGMGIMRKLFKTPHIDFIESTEVDTNSTLAAKFWSKKEISLKDIALVIFIAFSIVAISILLSHWIGSISISNGFGKFILSFVGNKYILITTLTMTIATVFSKNMKEIGGSQEIGTFLIYMFFVVIGIPASIPAIIFNAPILLVFTSIMVIINMIVTFGAAKIFGFGLEETILASNANIGGPTTAAAFAISKGWTKLIGPIMLIGTLGYIIGNYAGVFIGNLFVMLGF